MESSNTDVPGTPEHTETQPVISHADSIQDQQVIMNADSIQDQQVILNDDSIQDQPAILNDDSTQDQHAILNNDSIQDQHAQDSPNNENLGLDMSSNPSATTQTAKRQKLSGIGSRGPRGTYNKKKVAAVKNKISSGPSMSARNPNPTNAPVPPQLQIVQNQGPSQQPVPTAAWVPPAPILVYRGPISDLEAYRHARYARYRPNFPYTEDAQLVAYMRIHALMLYNAMLQTGDVSDPPLKKTQEPAQAVNFMKDGHFNDDTLWLAAWKLTMECMLVQVNKGVNGIDLYNRNVKKGRPSPRSAAEEIPAIDFKKYPNFDARFAEVHNLYWHWKATCKNALDHEVSDIFLTSTANPESIADKKKRIHHNNSNRLTADQTMAEIRRKDQAKRKRSRMYENDEEEEEEDEPRARHRQRLESHDSDMTILDDGNHENVLASDRDYGHSQRNNMRPILNSSGGLPGDNFIPNEHGTEARRNRALSGMIGSGQPQQMPRLSRQSPSQVGNGFAGPVVGRPRTARPVQHLHDPFHVASSSPQMMSAVSSGPWNANLPGTNHPTDRMRMAPRVAGGFEDNSINAGVRAAPRFSQPVSSEHMRHAGHQGASLAPGGIPRENRRVFARNPALSASFGIQDLNQRMSGSERQAPRVGSEIHPFSNGLQNREGLQANGIPPQYGFANDHQPHQRRRYLLPAPLRSNVSSAAQSPRTQHAFPSTIGNGNMNMDNPAPVRRTTPSRHFSTPQGQEMLDDYRRSQANQNAGNPIPGSFQAPSNTRIPIPGLLNRRDSHNAIQSSSFQEPQTAIHSPGPGSFPYGAASMNSLHPLHQPSQDSGPYSSPYPPVNMTATATSRPQGPLPNFIPGPGASNTNQEGISPTGNGEQVLPTIEDPKDENEDGVNLDNYLRFDTNMHEANESTQGE